MDGKTPEPLENGMMSNSASDSLQTILDQRTPKGWYGLAAPKGWWPIIEEAHNQIVGLYPDYKVLQIKQKFGGLRYYCSVDGDEDVRRIIRAAELLCEKTCEICGKLGSLQKDGYYYYVACEDHQTPKKDQGH